MELLQSSQINPRIPDAKREYGYIFRVEVKNGKAYRQYDHIYRWHTGPYPGAEEINVYIDNELLVADVPPVVTNNRTLVPARFLAESLNAKVGWDGNNRTVEILFPD